MKLLGIVALVLIVVVVAAAAAEDVRPKKFCDCPDHKRPADAASASTGTSYRLYGYNDAFRSSPTEQWCYTRAVWFERVSASGRFEWRSSTKREVLAGAVKESEDPCGAYYNHYGAVAGPSKQGSTIQHGSALESSTDISLHYADKEEFNPSWPQQLKSRISSLVGFVVLPGSNTLTRVAIRVKSFVSGSAPPYSIQYEIESATRTSLNINAFGRGPSWADQHSRVYWEAAVSREFYDEMAKQGTAFMDGGTRVKFLLQNVPAVESAVGRLLILPPGVPPPPPGGPVKDALLLGTASAFRVGPTKAPLPGEKLIPTEQLRPRVTPR